MKVRSHRTELTGPELEDQLQAVWSGLIQLAFSQPRERTPDTPDKVTARIIEIKDGLRVQFTETWGARERHRNEQLAAARETTARLLRTQFQRLHLFSTLADVVIKANRLGGYEWRQTPPTKVARQLPHNRSKQYLIPDGTPCPFLERIGVMNREGKVLAAKYHKFRQINRFLELIDDVLPHLPVDRPVRVVDFGSGKSYLTFALHHLLKTIRGREVQVVGVDRKADVIRDCAAIAEELQCEGLRFAHGDISEFGGVDQVDLMVALHACDTATDAALAQAVRWQTPVIMAVPCCQHEFAARYQPSAALGAITSHGILNERFAALATDALRANILELCGYQTRVMEFIELEHTPKNLLIRAIRQLDPATPDDAVRKYHQFVELIGIDQPWLTRALRDLLPASMTTVSNLTASNLTASIATVGNTPV